MSEKIVVWEVQLQTYCVEGLIQDKKLKLLELSPVKSHYLNIVENVWYMIAWKVYANDTFFVQRRFQKQLLINQGTVLIWNISNDLRRLMKLATVVKALSTKYQRFLVEHYAYDDIRQYLNDHCA